MMERFQSRRHLSLRWAALACVLLAASAPAQSTPAQSTPAQSAPSVPTAKPDPLRAEQAYLSGARLLDRKDLAGAQNEFAKAVALDPTRNDFALALTLTREHRVGDLIQQAAQARLANRGAQADSLLAEARKVDPGNELVLEHAVDSVAAEPLVQRTQVKPAEEPGFLPPIQIAPAEAAKDLHLRGDTRQVVTQAVTAYGIKAVFDDSVTSTPLRFDLDRSPYMEAMPILLRMAHLFAVPIDPKTLLVAKDTEENRQRLERQVEETIYIPASTVEQLNELSNIVKNVFDVRQVVTSAGSGTILLRAPEPTLKAVNYTLADLLDGGAEVMVDVKLVSIDKSITRNIGATPPTQLNAFSAAAELQSFVAANQSTITTAISQGALVPTGSTTQMLVQEAAFLILSGLATDAKLTNVLALFGNGLTLFGVSLGSSGNFNLALNSSEARALDDISVRVGDRQTATLRVGSKYPITTATYSSGVSSATAAALAGKSINGVSASSLLSQYLGSAATSTVPLVQFEDLGITLKTTPTVLRSGLVSMHIDLKIEALTGASSNNIPVLTSRAFTSDITVADGMSAVMLSDLSSTEAISVSGFPGLGELPGFQETVSDRLKETDSSELVLLITPHLVRRRSASMSSRRIAFRTSVPVDF